jgi:ABC-type spermidine/putrescine transport system permease subunit II/ABC-type Fe3+ transport system substrate-binding protein
LRLWALLTQVEASKNNPNWGLLWVDGATAFAGLDTQGLLLKGFEPSVAWNSLGTQSLPADKSYTPTGVTLMAALAYNKNKVKSPPTTWQQLLEPQWKGQVDMNDPSQINLALVQSSAAIGAALGDKNIGIEYLHPVTLLPSAIGIDAKAPAAEQAEAEKFIEFVLSPAGQKVMQSGDPTGDSLYYPVIQGVSPLASLPSLASTTTQTINPYTCRELRGRSRALATADVAPFFVVALGVPGFGAVSASLLADYGGSFSLTLANYHALFAQTNLAAAAGGGLLSPLERSLGYGAVTATITVTGGFIAARLLARRRTKATGALDFLLLASVALPGVVFGAGYIFAYNLPIMSRLGINLYQTVTLLIIAYTAASLPTNARVLVGAVSQLQPSLKDAARTHGAGALVAWARGVLPVVSRPIVMAWMFTFCGVFLELPLSQLLYAPGSPPASIAIEDNLSTYHFGVGMAQSVLAVAIALAAVGVVLGGYRLLAPAGWRRIGGAVRG